MGEAVEQRRDKRVSTGVTLQVLIRPAAGGAGRWKGEVRDLSYRGGGFFFADNPPLHVGQDVMMMFGYSKQNREAGIHGVTVNGVVRHVAADRDGTTVGCSIDDVREKVRDELSKLITMLEAA